LYCLLPDAQRITHKISGNCKNKTVDMSKEIPAGLLAGVKG